MESHILNIYHQQRFRSIGHKILRSTSESLSSEGSCQQNSPEYIQEQQTNQYEEESIEGEYWEPTGNQGQVWDQTKNENYVSEQSNQDMSSDEEENNIHVEEVSFDRTAFNVNNINQLDIENIENDSLVEGLDYDIIQVYAVHPDFDLEVSSEEDEPNDYCLGSYTDRSRDYYSSEQNTNYNIEVNHAHDKIETPDIGHDGLGINLDTPVVSNVDEYFIKDNKENHILEVKDRPVVDDVDEYFIKEVKPEQNIPKLTENEQNIPNVDEFFAKNEIAPTTTEFHTPKIPIDTNIFGVSQSVSEGVHLPETVKQETPAEVSINDSDLDVPPNIEEIKKYLLEDIPYIKLKSAQKSCSVPHSPMHSICMDLDAKTCLSFEDLNLDLSDLNFDNEKDKSVNSSKSDDIPRTLTDEDVNSFLITNKTQPISAVKVEDDLNPQDMEIENSMGTAKDNIEDLSSMKLDRNNSSTPIPGPTVLGFCIEKSAVKKENEPKTELDDFVDVESCNETVPVLEANNLNSLLEQFEATEKFNSKPQPLVKLNEQKIKPFVSLLNGMRLQDAGAQLNKNKMRQIMMPSTANTAVRRSPSPVRSDHDYCSSKKRHSLPNLRRGQSLLKPEVLSSNSRILNSRHRSCKNKKIVYHLSSDDESEKCNTLKIKKSGSHQRAHEDNDVKAKKSVVKQPAKATVPSTCRKKTSPVHSVTNDVCFDKRNGSVMVNNACKASDNTSSQSSNGRIKLTIKNKSEVIIKNCDDIKYYKKEKKPEKSKSCSVSEKSTNHEVKTNSVNSIRCLDVKQNKNKIVNTDDVHDASISVKEEFDSKPEHFYTTLFNKQDVRIPVATDVKSQKQSHGDLTQPAADAVVKIEVEQPQKKKKLNLQEYKLRRGVSSNSSSATVSPEAIFPDMPIPDMPIPDAIGKIAKVAPAQAPFSDNVSSAEKTDVPKRIFDPIREASRKILMNTKKQKAEAMRKRDEDIVMSKIPKVENLELQPLISEAEMLKIVGMSSAADILPLPKVPEKPQQLSDYDELVLMSIGTNTDEQTFKDLERAKPESEKKKPQTPPADTKTTINFKIRRSDNILKQNVFDMMQKDRSPTEEKKHPEIKICKDRFKDITATLKSVEKQVDTKISSNSLFASIQDVVMKKAPEVSIENSLNEEQKSKLTVPLEKKLVSKTSIVRSYDTQAEHGEDKIILHLEKSRTKPVMISVSIQTDTQQTIKEATSPTRDNVANVKASSNRKRTESDMSMSSGCSPDRAKGDPMAAEVELVLTAKPRTSKREAGNAQAKEERSNSRERHEAKYRRPRSPSRARRRKRSSSRNSSTSRGRHRRYRRSDSPYKRKKRAHTRSPYRKRHSPSPGRREYRNRSLSRSKRLEHASSSSPAKRIKLSPQYDSNAVDKKIALSTTPPLIRKHTISESSDSSSSSSLSSSSGSSGESVNSRQSGGSYKTEDLYKRSFTNISSDDRESSTPVEERRIVFVGKLEKNITKAVLRSMFLKFGQVTEVRLHIKEDGTRYGFVTFRKSGDAWAAVEAAGSFPHYDVGFGGRRAFCRQSYADLDGLEAKYTESAFHGQAAPPVRRADVMSFEQMLLEVKKKLNQRKGDKLRHDDPVA